MSAAVELDDLLLAHAAGRLPPPLALLMEAHLALSPGSRRRFALLLEVGGLLLERLEPAPLRQADPEALLARADGDKGAGTAADDPPPHAPGWWEEARAVLTRLGGAPVVQLPLALPGGPRAGICAHLARLAAGAALPPHGHPGLELTLVLEGELHDGARRFARGALMVCDETTVHAPRAGPAGCLALALLCCRWPLAA